MRISDWSSDVCSSDLPQRGQQGVGTQVLAVCLDRLCAPLVKTLTNGSVGRGVHTVWRLGSLHKGGGRRHAGRNGQDFVAGIGNEYAVFPLRRQAVVAGDDRPAIGKLADFFATGVDHGLDREDHARFQALAGSGLAVVKDLGVLVELAADTVAAIYAYDREALFFGMLLDDRPDKIGRAHV